MAQRRVLVTGMGAVTASGRGVPALWAAVREGRSGVGALAFEHPVGNRVRIGAAVPDFEPVDRAGRLPPCDRFAALALAAADEALAQAGVAPGTRLGPRTAVVIGTGVGGAATIEAGIRVSYTGEGRLDPMSVPRLMANAAASQVSARWGITGPSFSVGSACASAAQAIGFGAMMVRHGLVDRALAGGAEASLTPVGMRSWEALRVLAPERCRPFARTRSGMVLGEGAGLLVLEAEEIVEQAAAAPPLAELVGYGTTSDAGDLLRPDPAGAAAAMAAALADAGLGAEAVGYVNAHGTGTIANDAAEAEALRLVFGNRLPGLPVSSTKPVHGHALGAAGGIEAIVALMALREGTLPPTLNHDEPDPACPLDVVAEGPRAADLNVVQSNSFAFGGINAVLLFGHA